MTVTVTVSGTQRLDGETARTHLTATGTLQQKGQACRLIYDEPATAETPSATTVIVVTPHRVTIERKSDTCSSLTLEPCRPHVCPYHTPYGTLSLTVATHTVVNELTMPQGRLFLAYSLDTGDGKPIEHTIEILIKEVSA